MKARKESLRTRREFLSASLAAPALLLIDGPFALSAFAAARELEPTPACGDPDAITPSQTAGPFYRPSSPGRKSLLEPGMRGARIVVEGEVLSTRCQPVPLALLDFWHADARGLYDNAGYRLRGHQFTDREGRYRLETIVPGLYPGRTRHFHVIVQAAGRPILTTQLYFPDEPANKSDWIFNPKLLVSLCDAPGGKAAKFNFVVHLG